MEVNQDVNIQRAEKKEKIVNDTICTILGMALYSTGSLLCVGVGMMLPSIAIGVYSVYGLIGLSLGCLATRVLKEDIKEYKKHKEKERTFYEHFPIKKVDYEKRPRYQVDREINCKVEDFYKTESDYATNFVYEKEDNQNQKDVTLTKKKKYR